MTIKIVFLDIDGTTYDVGKDYVADSVVESVLALKEKGIKVCVCTGRGREHLQGINKKLLDLPFDAYITSCGAESFTAKGTIIHRLFIDENIAKKLLEYSKNVNYELDVMFIDELGAGCLNKMGSSGMFNYNWFNLKPHPIRQPDAAHLIHILFAEKNHHDDILKQLDGTKHFVTSEESIEAYREGVNKLLGAKAVCDYFNLNLSEAMAFGDGEVDVELLQGVGLGIAMGNGSDEAKDAAKEVCEDMFSDGIWKSLKRHEVI